MKNALFTIASLALVCSCNTKQEADKPAAPATPPAAAKPSAAAPAPGAPKAPSVAPAAPAVPAAPAAPSAAPAATPAAAPASDDHIFKYTITTDFNGAKDQIAILVAMNSEKGKYPVKYDLDCEGDGDFEYKGLTENQKCVYKKDSGNHQIWLRGEIPAMILCGRAPEPCPKGAYCEQLPLEDGPVGDDDSRYAVISIDSWGQIPWKTMKYFVAQCGGLTELPKEGPDLRQVKDMSLMFFGTDSFNQSIEHWDVSNVTNMSGMFWDAWDFNQPLGKWNVSNVTDMSGMFEKATSFDQPLDQWDVSKVTNMNGMFAGAEEFSHYPKNWVVPANASRAMFAGTKVEDEADRSPLKTR